MTTALGDVSIENQFFGVYRKVFTDELITAAAMSVRSLFEDDAVQSRIHYASGGAEYITLWDDVDTLRFADEEFIRTHGSGIADLLEAMDARWPGVKQSSVPGVSRSQKKTDLAVHTDGHDFLKIHVELGSGGRVKLVDPESGKKHTRSLNRRDAYTVTCSSERELDTPHGYAARAGRLSLAAAIPLV